MTRPAELYDELLSLFRKAAFLESAASVLGWDRETFMPPGGAEHRAGQLSVLSGLHHQMATDPRIEELLDALQDSELTDSAESDSAVNLREIRRVYDRQRRLPQRLVEELARVTALAQHHWVAARRADDFSAFAPWLTQVVRLKQEEAQALQTESQNDAYDALLDEYEPGMSGHDVDAVFRRLRQKLVTLLDTIRGAPRRPDEGILTRDYPTDVQERLGRRAAEAIGFDFHAGRLDVAAHPFCSGTGPGDCRMTTRYDPQCFSTSFFGTLHETGHALYEQGLPADAWGTPLGTAVSLGIHESQSRLWENIVGRSPAFWEHFYPLVQEAFPASLGGTPIEDFVFAINAVRPSLIRVEADEVTYNLHIMMRFDLERALIQDALSVEDLPVAWNERFERDFGMRPPGDADGCMQDVHWSAGLFGYFPTYALGNMYAAQFFEAVLDDLGDLHRRFAQGEFSELLSWLRHHIHSQGQRFPAARLVEAVTGKPLSDEPLMRHLEDRFLPLYQPQG